jgi:hypothetical protein
MDDTVFEHRKVWTLRMIDEPPPDTVPAWEQIEAGRYMPRRTRGSFPGRELG